MDLIMTQLRQLKMAAMAKALELQRQNPHNYNGLSFEEAAQRSGPAASGQCGGAKIPGTTWHTARATDTTAARASSELRSKRADHRSHRLW